MEQIGWLSTIFLGACGIPLSLAALWVGEDYTPRLFLWTWYIGEILGVIYCLHLGSLPLLANYGFNTLLITPVLYYNYFPRSKA